MIFEIGGVTAYGGEEDEPLVIVDFDPGDFELKQQFTQLPWQDGVVPGSDLLGEAVWGWELAARGADLAEVLAAHAKLKRVWRDPSRKVTGEVVPLRYYLAGRWRRVYGRPGHIETPKPNYLAIGGYGRFGAEFHVTRSAHYDDMEQSVLIPIVPASTGGLMAPLVAPLSTARSGAPRAGLLANAGDTETPVTIRFTGPIGWPLIKASTGWEIGISAVLAYDDVVVVDPIAGTVTKNGVPAPQLLSPRSRVKGALLQPGITEVTFTGTDATGTAAAVLSWRNAYTSI